MLKETITKLKKTKESNEILKDKYFKQKKELEKNLKKIIKLYPEFREDIVHIHPMVRVSDTDMHKPATIRGYVQEFSLEYFNIDQSFWTENLSINIRKYFYNKDYWDKRTEFSLSDEISGYVVCTKIKKNCEINEDKYLYFIEKLFELEEKINKLVSSKIKGTIC